MRSMVVIRGARIKITTRPIVLLQQPITIRRRSRGIQRRWSVSFIFTAADRLVQLVVIPVSIAGAPIASGGRNMAWAVVWALPFPATTIELGPLFGWGR